MQKDLALLGLRIVLGSIFIVHACDKFGWHSLWTLWEVDEITAYSALSLAPFVGLVGEIFTFLDTSQSFWLAVTAASIELISGWCLVLGVFTRLAGLLLTLMMAVAVYFHFPYGFYGNEGGYEWAMLCLAGSQSITLMGAGQLSLHALLQAVTTRHSSSV